MFELDATQRVKLAEWVKVQKPLEGYGAIGGALTYEFTPTSLGTVTKVYYLKGHPNETSIDITDYEDW